MISSRPTIARPARSAPVQRERSIAEFHRQYKGFTTVVDQDTFVISLKSRKVAAKLRELLEAGKTIDQAAREVRLTKPRALKLLEDTQ